MKKTSSFVGILLSLCVIGSSLDIPAKASEKRQTCQTSLDGAVSTVTRDRSIAFVDFNEHSIANTYSRYPRQRPTCISYVFSGNGATGRTDLENVLNSPVMLGNIAEDIMATCDAVSMVGFAMQYTDWEATFVFMDDGTVRPVECAYPMRPELYRPRWGEMVCF